MLGIDDTRILPQRGGVVHVLDVPAAHEFEPVVFAQFRRPRQHGVAGHAFAVVVALLVPRGRGTFARTFGPRVIGVGHGEHVALGVVAIVADVDLADQHVLDEIEGEFRFVVQVELVVFAPRVPFDESGPAHVDGRVGPGSVGVLFERHREALVVHHARRGHRERLSARGQRRLVRKTAHERGGVLDAEPFGRLHGAFGQYVVLVVAFVAGVVDTVLMEETARHVVRRLVRSARNREVVLVSGGVVLVEYLVPVGVAEVLVAVVGRIDPPLLVGGVAVAAFQFAVPCAAETEDVVDVGRIGGVAVGVRFEVGGRPVVAVVDQFGRHGALVEVVRTVVGDLHLAFFGAFGGDEDDAERTARTVDGRRRGVLQYRDALDVFGVDRRDVGLHAVDEDEGRTARTDRVGAAHLERGAARGFTVGEGDRQAGDGTLQRTRHVLVGADAVGDILAGYLFDSAYDVALLLHAVTYDHDLFERSVVFGQYDVDRRSVVDLDELGLVADIAEIQRLLG